MKLTIRRSNAAVIVTALLACPAIAWAAPEPCPQDPDSIPGFFVCTVVDGDSELIAGVTTFSFFPTHLDRIELSTGPDVREIRRLVYQKLPIWDFGEGAYLVGTLDSYTQDPDTKKIELVMSGPVSNPVQVTITFTLSDLGATTVIDESVSIFNPGATQRSLRLLAISDWVLLGFSNSDDSVQATPDGGLITQRRVEEKPLTATPVTATQEATNPLPDAFQVNVCCALDDALEAGQLITLNGTPTVPGPNDFEYGVSWDENVGSGQTFDVSLRKTVTVPEPAAFLLALGALLTLAVLKASLRPGPPEMRAKATVTAVSERTRARRSGIT
jgi:hypothetical protein